MLGRNSNPKICFNFNAWQIRGRFTTAQPSNPRIASGDIHMWSALETVSSTPSKLEPRHLKVMEEPQFLPHRGMGIFLRWVR